MELRSDRWLVRWYFWALEIWNVFLGKYYCYYPDRERTNLCHFVRVIIVYCPLVLVAHLATAAAMVVATVVFPIWLFGLTRYFVFLGIVTLLGGLVAVLQFSWFWTEDWRSRLWPETKTKKEKAKPEKSIGPSFFRILWKFIVATKRNVCPIITFTSQREGGKR